MLFRSAAPPRSGYMARGGKAVGNLQLGGVLFSFPPCLKKNRGTFKNKIPGFPGGAVAKNPPANAGDTDLIPGPGRSHMP